MSLCTAKRSNHESCKAKAIRGGNVCRVHGGAAPQVRRKAAERLAAMIDPALAVLAATLRQKIDKRLSLSAAGDILNRNSLNGKQHVEVSGGLSLADVLRARRARRLDAGNSAKGQEL